MVRKLRSDADERTHESHSPEPKYDVRNELGWHQANNVVNIGYLQQTSFTVRTSKLQKRNWTKALGFMM
jgi:hypothetical protein